MGKKALRRQITALEQKLEHVAVAEKIARHDREELEGRLADAGLLLVTGPRTQSTKVRAARAGVIVLQDLDLLDRPRFEQTQDEPVTNSFGLRSPGLSLVRYTVSLTLTGDPELMQALADGIRS